MSQRGRIDDESTLTGPPLSRDPTRTSVWRLLVRVLPWILVALPALYQLGLLTQAIAGRITYPYDLEWMEGGLLHHALRIQRGEGIYVPPSVDFIPYLYTPLYPGLLALIGQVAGLGYTLGRTISVLALGGIAVTAIAQQGAERHTHAARGPVLAGAALGLGLFASTYPYVEGWFDLVRADTLFLLMVTGGLSGLTRWSTTGKRLGGHARVAAGGALLALSFFCKQTGIIYVAFGGLVVLVLAWRRVAAYVVAAGVVGLGGVWVLNTASNGWFWIYVSKIHRAHDFNMDRFKGAWAMALWHFPLATVVIAAALVIVLATTIVRRQLPSQARPLLLWSATYAVSALVGALGWGTEFAHKNAFMPALLHGALAAGAAIPALYGCLRPGVAVEPRPSRVWDPRAPRRELVATAVALLAAVPLAWLCAHDRWKPSVFIPLERDVAAGDALIERIRGIEGPVWMPSHPWYVVMAGKAPHVHRMGIKDVTTRQTHVVEGLVPMLAAHAFAAIILDEPRDVNSEVSSVPQYYRPSFTLPATERPRVFTGAPVVPAMIWVPQVPAAPPPGAHAVFDFEQGSWSDWHRSGPAWGNGPELQPLPGEGLLLGTTGMRFATSMHGGDKAIGRITSPGFVLDAPQLVLHLGGDSDETTVRAELWVDGAIVATAGTPRPGGSTLREVAMDVSKYQGKEATLTLVDDLESGHLIIDDVWLRR